MKRRANALITLLAVVLLSIGVAFASVPNTTFQNSYTADGVTTQYPFTWRLIDPTQMFVQINGVTQSSSLYTVQQNVNGIGGTVTFLSAPTVTNTILIERNSDLLQNNLLPNSGPLPAATLQDMVDKLTIICQQLETQIVNSGTLPVNPAKGTLLAGNGTGWQELSAPLIDGQQLTSHAAASTGLDWETGSGGGGTGSGTVNFGSAGQIAVYPGNGMAVSGANSVTAAQMLALSSGQFYLGNSSNVVTPTTASGDVALSPSGVFTLSNSGVTAGTITFPSAITVDAKGRVTAMSGGRFVSSQLSLAGSSDISATHLLGVTPIHIWAVLICTTANGGYSPGDQVVLYPSASASTTNGFNMLADGTTVHMYTEVGAFIIPPKGGGAGSGITNADWKVELVAEP